MSWTLKRKAQQLLAGEEGAIRKDWGGRTSVALVYPNTYAVGMSNLGFQAIYSHLNAIPEVVCERVFFPDPEDLDEQLRTETAPFSLESLRPLTDFDLVGFSVTYEGDYINLVRMLRLAGIPPRAADRGPEHPVILMGGVCTENSDVQTSLPNTVAWTQVAMQNQLRGMFSWRLDNDHGRNGQEEDVNPTFTGAKAIYDTVHGAATRTTGA